MYNTGSWTCEWTLIVWLLLLGPVILLSRWIWGQRICDIQGYWKEWTLSPDVCGIPNEHALCTIVPKYTVTLVLAWGNSSVIFGTCKFSTGAWVPSSAYAYQTCRSVENMSTAPFTQNSSSTHSTHSHCVHLECPNQISGKITACFKYCQSEQRVDPWKRHRFSCSKETKERAFASISCYHRSLN